MHPETDDLLDQINTLMHALKGQLQQALRGDPEQLAPLEARALRYFSRHPGATQAELALATGRDKAQVTRVVRELEQRGWLQREQGAADRRSFGLRLTDSGRIVQKKVQLHRRRLNAAMVAGMSPEEQALIAAQLARMRANVTSK